MGSSPAATTTTYANNSTGTATQTGSSKSMELVGHTVGLIIPTLPVVVTLP